MSCYRNPHLPLLICYGVRSGAGLMIHSRGDNASTAEIVWSQILQGMGGGMASVTQQVGAQASVPHADVAIVTAAVLLLTEIGGAIGTAIGTHTNRGHLERRMMLIFECSWGNLD